MKKQLRNLDKKQAERILVKIYLLGDDPYPRGVDHLTGQRAYRIRTRLPVNQFYVQNKTSTFSVLVSMNYALNNRLRDLGR